jgi:hypothetical protein
MLSEELMRSDALLAGVLITLSALSVACDGLARPAVAPAPTPNPAPPPPANPAQALAGSYTLTIDIAESCAELPEAARRRTYSATLDQTPYGYFTIRVVGGGYDAPTVTGDMKGYSAGHVSFDWNSFDIGGCDGRPESLPDGRTLMICGSGVGVSDEKGIAATLSGEVSITDADGKRQQACAGRHPFTFRRTMAPGGNGR